ncbi:MAG: hypothetical protein IK025_12240 [Bacteroidales bacterium]|nr:hypothetical protein [Bacteroidales bacterium]
MKSSIIDVPRKYSEADLFGIQKYQNALIKFIRLTDTPITIALQGEWGSGKTSLMNQLRYELCDKDDAPYFSVWINTWQFSLMKTPSQAIMSILEGCINQIGALNPNEHKWDESKKKIGGIFKKMASVGAKVAASTVGVDGDVVEGLFGGESSESDILQLKGEIAKLIDEALKSNPSKVGFTFYIDDLDRIDPPVAVEILELLKNIFDLDKCVFILAIDYDVVIKGLKSKFGELTDKNEREFRAFFDKIIQLPFSMPVASYNVDTFLVDALQKIEFFTSKELEDETLAENLSEIARLSVGCNPRSLKRLSNTLSLISIINEGDDDNEENDTNSAQTKLINFALVCMQIAYPFVYNQLAEEPDFKKWNEGIAAKLKLRHLTEEEKESLNAADEFNEEWEKVLFRMCQKETYLSIRAFQVSGLLNKIAEIINNDENLGEIVESVIALSAVTNLKAFDSTPQNKRKVSQAANDIIVFFEKFVADLKPSIPSIKAAKGKTYGRIYDRNGYFGTRFLCSPKDNSFTLQIYTENRDMVEKFNTLTNTELSKYHFNYHLGKKNQNLHKWEAQLDGDYRVDTENIKQACIEFYNAVVKL